MGRRGALAAAVLGLLVTGCGAGDEAQVNPNTGSDSPSSSPSSSTPTTADSPAVEPTPTVEPAAGVELEVKGFRVNAPAKWRINNDTIFGDTAIGPAGGGRSGAILLAPSAVDQMSLAQAMRRSWGPGKKPAGFEERPTGVLGGLSAFYYTAESGNLNTEHVLGNWDSGYVVELNIELPNALSAERQQEIVDSIVATYRSPRDG